MRQPILYMEQRICMCAHIADVVYAHISCASRKRVPIKCIRPDAVEYDPAGQRLQSRDPGGERNHSRTINQRRSWSMAMYAAV